MPYYDFNGNQVDYATYQNQFGGGKTISAMQNAVYEQAAAVGKEKGEAYATADATAVREAGDMEAADNRNTAAATNGLAQRLAMARRTPGGGIRMGSKRKGISANTAGVGLNTANAAGRLTRRKNELRAQADQSLSASQQQRGGGGFSVGPMISLW